MNYKSILPIFLSILLIPGVIAQETEIDKEISPLQQLISEIEKGIDIEKRFDFSRANTKEKKLAELKRINTQLEKDLARAEALSKKLTSDFDNNEKTLAELEEKLTLKLGNLGEMFGVVKQVSGQTRGEFKNSITNIDNPNRDTFLRNLAESKKLPNLNDISALWVELLKEISNSKFGKFTSNGSDNGTFTVDIDPTRGAILEKLIQKKTFFQRIADGGLVGYVIILLGLFGVALSAERIYILREKLIQIQKQEEDIKSIGDNLLGELLQVAKDNVTESIESLEIILDEKIQSVTPMIETRVKAIKLIATVAPLLGLLGTVIGMIETFQAITLFGTGDPKLMAGGISQALVTTMLGLIVAAPLLFLHSYAENYSKSIIGFLEEKASGIVAMSIKK